MIKSFPGSAFKALRMKGITEVNTNLPIRWN
jgi:hypothetical protein